MSRLIVTVSCCLLLAALIFGCGSDPAGPGGDPDPDPDPEPNPDGVLLEGDDADEAAEALVELPPSPVDETDVLEDRLLTTRLVAFLDPEATVAEVNQALEAAGARIVSMLPDHLFLTLKIRAGASAAEAEALGDQLVASGAFLMAQPDYAFLPEMPVSAGMGNKDLPPASGQPLEHLKVMRMPAAWNAKGLARYIDTRVAILVPDSYADDEPLEEIDCQDFLETAGITLVAFSDGVCVGNHGYHVCGTIGANYDGTRPTGIHPYPEDQLDLQSFEISLVGFRDLLQDLLKHLPLNTPFVLNTSLGYPAYWLNSHRLEAVQDALAWREMFAPHADSFLHITTAGNGGADPGLAGDARFNWYTTISHFFGDLREPLRNQGLSEADSAAFWAMWENVTTRTPAAATAMTNTLVVGNSNASGGEHSDSGRNSEVRACGERVYAPCHTQDPAHGADADLCDGNVARYSGTSMAAPQVAGLAAYIWSLNPDLTVAEVREKIVHAYDNSSTPGIVDAYIAVLSLDNFYFDHRVRDAILDVSGADGQPGSDGVFDEKDLTLYVQAFNAAAGAEDHSRYDLNGDGRTGGSTTAKFDLTYDPVPQWLGGETALTDCDILEYYAYHPDFYSGDEAQRDLIMVDCIPIPTAAMTRMNVQLHFAATVTYHPSGDTQDFENLEVYIMAAGGVNGDSFTFNVDTAVDAEGRKVPVQGSISGTFADGGRSLAAFNANYVVQPFWGDLQRVFYAMTDVPFTGYSADPDYQWITYEVVGPATCGHISYLNNAAENGGWTVTDYTCTGLSGFRVYMSDTPTSD